MTKHWLQIAIENTGVTNLPEDIAQFGDIEARWSGITEATQIIDGEIAEAVASYFQMPRADFKNLDKEFASQVTESVARTHHILPLYVEGSHAVVATSDPTMTEVLDELAFSINLPVQPVIASPSEITAHLDEIFGDDATELDDWGKVSSSLLAAEMILRKKDGTVLQPSSGATAKLFGELLRRAVNINASDTHIQPYGDGAVVRNRVDGVLYKALMLPAKVHEHLVRHVKAISGLDPTQHLTPQDGELRMEVAHKEIDLRLSILPVGSSERLVVRYLPQNQVRALRLLRLDNYELERLEKLARNTDGMMLMTGPTGSGKTSLLYALLAEKNTSDINIMTVEEPVEYRLRGASQINVEPKTGLTFARSLRSILRQDPDVVMVGEIRDEETAGIAAQAAMTGHFVLSTVHTLDALLAIVRMRDLGVSSTTLADALHSVASQRLIRKLCEDCRTPLKEEDFTEDEKRFASLWTAPQWRAVGCESCRSTGYSGRLPVLEIVEITGEIKRRLREGDDDIEALEMLAAQGGTRFLAEGFARRLEEGSTTVEEIIRVYGQGFFDRLERQKNYSLAFKK